MQKQNKRYAYKLMKPFVVMKFKMKYHPVIIGIENIPENGPIVICGNHRHKDDQYNVMMVTKRIVHYMAKDEYFKGKMAWFYRAAACIPVDRSIHDEHAKSEAMDVLNNGGALGIFPEGTRNEVICKEDKLNELYQIVKNNISKKDLIKKIKNRSIRYTQVELLIKLNNDGRITDEELKEYVMDADENLKELLRDNKITKEEYEDSLLLDLKFGAVSLASKTNALIIPYATSGYYDGKKNQLITRIGKPLDIKGMDLESANRLLREKIIELMQNN